MFWIRIFIAMVLLGIGAIFPNPVVFMAVGAVLLYPVNEPRIGAILILVVLLVRIAVPIAAGEWFVMKYLALFFGAGVWVLAKSAYTKFTKPQN